MGIDISNKFLVGLYFHDFPDDVKDQALGPTGFFAELNISSASPYYDCPYHKCFYGYSILETEVELVIEELKKNKEKFVKLFGVNPEVYAGPSVW